MGLFKFVMTLGKSSLGETVKVLTNDYNMFAPNGAKETNRKEIFEFVFNHRKLINSSFKEIGDKLQFLEFEDFYEKLSFGSSRNFNPSYDLPVLIFCILYYESKPFREQLRIRNEKSRKDIFEVVHETAYKYSPKAVLSIKREFVEHVEDLFYLFNSTSIDY